MPSEDESDVQQLRKMLQSRTDLVLEKLVSEERHADVHMFRLIVFCVSAAMFLVSVFILISGWCMQRAHVQNHKSQLEFISTQMGACLEKQAFVTYSFVVGMALQMFLLLDSFLRCIHSVGARMKTAIMTFIVSGEQIATWCAVLVINFITNMASVAEFRSEGSNSREKVFHYCAAVLAISTFWAIHMVICVYLRVFAHAPDYKYICIKNVYLALIVLFFLLWLGQLLFMGLTEVAKVIEWIILLNGLIMQCYAEYSLKEHTRSNWKVCIIAKDTSSASVYSASTGMIDSIGINKCHPWVRVGSLVRPTHDHYNLQNIPSSARTLYVNNVCINVLSTFVITCILFYITAPPWFVHGNRIISSSSSSSESYVSTGPEFWSFVIATNVIVATQLLSAA
jgi:hypothetical protein